MLPIGDQQRQHRVRMNWGDWRPTFVAAGLTAVAVAMLLVGFDSVSTFERPVVLASLADSVLWIAASLIGVSGTIAALMLTTVSLLERLETARMRPRVLFHLRLTVLGALATIGFAVGALLLTTFPVAGGVDVQPPRWQIDVVYFGLLLLTALMIGAFAVVLSSLYSTVADVFRNLPEEWVDDILREDRQAAGAAQETRGER